MIWINFFSCFISHNALNRRRLVWFSIDYRTWTVGDPRLNGSENRKTCRCNTTQRWGLLRRWLSFVSTINHHLPNFFPFSYKLKRPWVILFNFSGSVWYSVLPYCLLNCGLAYVVYLLRSHDIRLTFSAQGHGVMSLFVSYLIVSKVYLSLDRYMSARTWAGHALTILRELNQLALTYTEPQCCSESRTWRKEVSFIIQYSE